MKGSENIKKKYSFNSIIKIWFITYIIVLLIPLLVNYFLFIHSRTIIEEETNSVRSAMLTQLKSNIDEKLYSLKQTSVLISNEPKAIGVVSADEKNILQEKRYQIIELVHFIDLLQTSNNDIDNVMLYLKNSNTMLYDRTYMENRYTYNYRVNTDIYKEYDQWVDFLNKEYKNDFIIMDLKKPQGNVERYISYAASLPYGNYKNSSGTLCVNINQNQLIEILDQHKLFRDAIVYILDENNQIIASNVKMKTPAFDYESLIIENTVYFGTYNQNKVAALMTRSEETNWKYIILTNKQIFSEKIFNYNKIVLLAIFIYTVLGIILAFWFTKRNYRPIKKIVKLISTKSLTDKSLADNDYLYLQQAFERAFFRLDEMEQKISQQNDLLRRNFMYKLLNGEIRDKEILETSLNKFEIKFDYGYYSVFIIHIDFYERTETLKNDIPIIKIAEYFKEIRFEDSKLYYVVRDNYIIFITNSDEETQAKLNRELYIWIEQLKLEMEKVVKLKLGVAVSNIHDSVFGITEAYHESLDCLDYILMYEPDEILFYKDIQSKEAYYYPISIEQKLINYIKAGNCEEADQLLKHLYKKNFEENAITMNMGKSLIFDISASILKAMDQQKNDDVLDEEKLLKSIVTSKSLREMMDTLSFNLHNVCNYFNGVHEKIDRIHYSQAINDYIVDHYADADLNISTLAEFFNLTPSYLSKLYKMETNEGILTYINKVRVNKSKSLLIETDDSIIEIAQKVGILHDTSFNRIFKNNEGITPGQYRKNNKSI